VKAQEAAQEPATVAPMPEEPPAPEPEAAAEGQLRLLVRDHRSGAALQAEVQVRSASAEPSADTHKVGADGRLALSLAPGRYVVEVRLKGYRKQRKSVEIEDQSVTMLDVALHARSKKK
jgi:hypothetical protein